jgi:hypothetical protein
MFSFPRFQLTIAAGRNGREIEKMRKTRISSPDLAWIFLERLKAFKDCPLGIVVAIVPDQKSGWLAILPKPKGSSRPLPRGRFEAIQRDLQRVYQLEAD